VLGATARKLRDHAGAWGVSPDGALIAFSTDPGKYGDREVWVMGPDGEQAQKLFETDEYSALEGGAWLPDGQRLVYGEEVHSTDSSDKVAQVFESRDFKGGPPVTVLKSGPWWTKGAVREFYWLPGGRILYITGEQDLNGDTCNYWELPVDARTGEPRGKPRQLTNWAGFCMDNTSASADGKRLAFRKSATQLSAYVAELEANGTRLSNPRQFTNTEGVEEPTRWTADSKALILESNRNGPYAIFKQSLDGNAGEPLLLAQSDTFIGDTCISPDGAWAVYNALPKNWSAFEYPGQPTLGRLMRVPITGGPPQWILTARMSGAARCARSPATLCAIAEQSEDHKQLIFTGFDPVKGRGRELTRFDIDPLAPYEWDLSPDGTRIAVVRYPGRRIDILSLNGQGTEVITVKGLELEGGIDWAADQKGLYMVSRTKEGRAALLHVDLQGNIHKLWEEPTWSDLWGIPSPDGRHLTFPHTTVNSNIWMIENF